MADIKCWPHLQRKEFNFFWVSCEVLIETKALSNTESHWLENNVLILANLSNSLTNTQSMQYTITGKQCDEWASVLNLLGLAELHKAGQISSCSSSRECVRLCVFVCVYRVKRLLILVVENQTALKLHLRLTPSILLLWSFCVPGQVNPVRGAEECALASSRVRVKFTSGAPLPFPFPHSNIQSHR